MIRAGIPMAVQVVIDDVGWWSAADTSAQGGPYRTALPRDHVPADYDAILELGRRLNMRPQAAFVLCDWDRDNILARIPSATWQGAHWRNPHRHDPRLDEVADRLRSQPDRIEIALHGLGHEYWIDGAPSRAEWVDREGRMRPADDVRRHLDAYAQILAQNRLGAFPVSYVPTAFLHRFDGAPGSLAAILAEYGIRYLSTPWHRLFFARPGEAPDFGIEAGILNVDRGRDACRWFDCEPALETAPLEGPIIGMHWPNLLARDPAENEQVVERWVARLKPLDLRFDRMLGADTAAAFSQLVYHHWVTLKTADSALDLDWSRVAAVSAPGLLKTFYIKVEAPSHTRFTADGLTILSVTDEFPGQWRIQVECPASGQRGRIEIRS